MHRLSYIIVSLVMVLSLSTVTAFAKPDWPTDTGVQSEAGIVMDMDSGAVLFAQNIHEQKIPASITKLLTALVVIENCDNLDAPVTFSHDAVYNIESGSGNKLALEEGDVLSVKDCLYVMLLQSSNQASNALAEYIGGSRSGFVDMMNRKVAELGCQESHFANPSGLNDDTQRTSAYDMALIAREAFKNPTLLEISSTKKASIPATINNPDGRTFSMEHKLVITEDESSEEYYPDAVAGKTGWTSQAGQTLVTYARRDGRSQIAVTLRSTQKTHYSDTKTIMDFGFARFKNVGIADNETDYVTGDALVTIGSETYEPGQLYIDKAAVITLPNDAQFVDAQKQLVTDLPSDHPEGAVAKLSYTYNERKIGDAWLFTTREQSVNTAAPLPSQEEPQTQDPQVPDSSGVKIPTPVFIVGGVILVLAALAAIGFFWIKKRQEAERQRQLRLREKRRQRLADIGFTEEDFERILEERRKQRDLD